MSIMDVSFPKLLRRDRNVARLRKAGRLISENRSFNIRGGIGAEMHRIFAKVRELARPKRKQIKNILDTMSIFFCGPAKYD